MASNNDSYIPISSDDLEKRMEDILNCWKIYFENISKKYQEIEQLKAPIEYSVNSVALRELVERVYQRRDYFARYHSGLVMSEFKEIGLNMFWISKFKPFHVTNLENIDKFAFEVNDDFAMFHMFTALKELADSLGLAYDSAKIPRTLYYEMSYCLAFRDVSKEALGMIVELIARIVIPDLPSE